jgi:hypothetical protein
VYSPSPARRFPAMARSETKSSIRSPIDETNIKDALGRPREKEAHGLRSRAVPLGETGLAAHALRSTFMAMKTTLAPRDAFLSSHQQGGAISEQRCMTARSLSPIRTICAWCAGRNRPAAVLVDVPIDDRGLSHGICPSCRASLRADSWTILRGSVAATPSGKWR